MFRKLLDEARAGDNVGVLAARREEGRRRARPGHREAGLDQAAQEIQGGSLRAEQRGRWPSHAVLHQLPAAILLPHDRRDRHREAGRRRRNGHAGRQRLGRSRVSVTPIAMEKTIRFAIREGGKTVGAGRVSDILD